MMPLIPAFPATAATRARRVVPVRSNLFNSITACWEMSGAEGELEEDLVGNSRLGSLGTVGSAAGKLGNCRTFDKRLNQYLECADNDAISIGKGATSIWISIWFNPTAVNAAQYLFGKLTGVAAGTLENRFQISASAVPQWNVSDGTNTPTRNGASVSAGAWSHASLVWTGSVIRVDVNGATGSTTAFTSTIRDGTAALRFGAGADGTTQLFNGELDITFFSRNYAVTGPDLAWNYNAGAGRSFTELQNYAPYQILLWYLLDKARRAIGLRPPRWAVGQLPRIPKRFRGRGAKVWRPAHSRGMV